MKQTNNIFLMALIVCLFAVSGIAQLRTPENVPVSFYGEVVDQEGRPVVGADVTFDLITSHMAEDSTETTPMTLHTDQDGTFALTGVTAYGIDRISVRKAGYYLSLKASRGFVFGHKVEYKPNPNDPVIFKMWKQRGKEPLVGSSWHGKVAGDGTTNRFDMLHGRRSSDGGLEIVCTRTPSVPQPPGNGHFDYKFEIAVVGGSIQPTGDEFTYLAPESDYAPSFTVEQKADAPKWRPDVTQEFYIKTADGHYGRLFVEWYAWQTPTGHCKWDCSINPSGSRNLER